MTTPAFDVLIIGAGPAGLAAALGLARQQHTALVFDSGVYRNALAKHAHNIIGWDHQDPATLRAKARQDLIDRYTTIKFHDSGATSLRKLESGSFEAVDDGGTVFSGRKLVLATGVRDQMLEIPGYSECWARGIFHCLYCHGYEQRGKPSTGLLAVGMLSDPKMAIYVANMALRLSDSTTVYTNGDETVADNLRAAVGARSQIRVNARKIASLVMASVEEEDSDVIVSLEDGSQIREGFLVHAPQAEVNGPIQELGLEMNPSGEIRLVTPFNETSVSGVFAGGDCITMMRAISQAAAAGGLAGAGAAIQIQAEDFQAAGV